MTVEKLSDAALERAAFNLSAEFGPVFVLPLRDFAVAAHREIAAALAYESAKAAPGGEVEGWKLVPVEVTEAMIEAGKQELESWTERFFDGGSYVNLDLALPDVFRRMFALVVAPAGENWVGRRVRYAKDGRVFDAVVLAADMTPHRPSAWIKLETDGEFPTYRSCDLLDVVDAETGVSGPAWGPGGLEPAPAPAGKEEGRAYG